MVNRREFLASAVTMAGVLHGRQDPFPASPTIERLGASTACLAGFPLLEALGLLRQLGFGTVEMITYTGAVHSVGEIPGFAYPEASPDERRLVLENTREFAHITGHLPFHELRPFSSDVATRRAALSRIRGALDGLAYLNGRVGVMHVGPREPGLRYRDMWPRLVDTLRALGDYAGERNLTLTIETMQPDSVRDFTELVFDVDHPAVGAAIDTGHIRGSADIGLPPERRDTPEARARFNDVLEQLVLRLGRKAAHVHLSDVTRADWTDHRTPGSGIIDFPRFFAALTRIDYGGVYVLELEEPDRVGALERSTAHVAPHIPRSGAAAP